MSRCVSVDSIDPSRFPAVLAAASRTVYREAMFPWTHIGTALTASYLASFVEFVEALTVVLAVGISRGWRFALAGAAAALVLLAAIVGLAGGSAAKIPLPLVRLAVGTLALLFGLRWLRKAILRSAGAIALHDEAAEFAEVSMRLRAATPGRRAWDAVAFATSFKIVMLEGIEVVFIVVALGANSHRWWPAISGALAAFITVVLLGLTLHRPLARIPENVLKFAVGVLLTAFGTFWVGEGLDLAWPGGDAMLGVLIAAYWSTAALLAAACRRRVAAAVPATRSNGAAPPAGGTRTGLRLFTTLFVDDRALAAGVLASVLLVRLAVRPAPMPAFLRGATFFLAIALLLGWSTRRAVAVRR